jgi:hypothetical protein
MFTFVSKADPLGANVARAMQDSNKCFVLNLMSLILKQARRLFHDHFAMEIWQDMMGYNDCG